MLFEIVIVLLPFIVGIVLAGLGHEITAPEFAEELERERNANN